MGFIDDLKSAGNEWKGKGPGYKVLVILSIFMTVSSLTGLADTVVKWRGFIKDGLEFYHLWVVGPIRQAFGNLLWEVTELQLDFFLVITLTATPLGIIVFSITEGDQRGVVKKVYLILALLTLSLLTPTEFDKSLKVAYIGSMIFILIIYSALALLSLNHMSGLGKYKSIIFRPLIAIAIVLILAAINKGFLSPIP